MVGQVGNDPVDSHFHEASDLARMVDGVGVNGDIIPMSLRDETGIYEVLVGA